jgi:hypothetical protein
MEYISEHTESIFVAETLAVERPMSLLHGDLKCCPLCVLSPAIKKNTTYLATF